MSKIIKLARKDECLVGKHVLSLMGYKNVNLVTVSKDTGIPLSTLHDLVKKGGKRIKPINICILASYFGVTEKELILGISYDEDIWKGMYGVVADREVLHLKEIKSLKQQLSQQMLKKVET